jgi:hypothetical protein
MNAVGVRLHAIVAMVLVAALALPGIAVAQEADASNLTEGQPLHLEDAEPGRGAQAQGFFRYSRTYQDEDQYSISPELQVGFGQYWHYQIAVPVLAGPADRTTSGDIQALLFRQINTEDDVWPAFAVAGELTAPTGLRSAGLDTRVKALLSKSIGSVPRRDRVHLNGDWYHNAARRPDERSQYYGIVLGYSHAWEKRMGLIVDFWRQQQKQNSQTYNLAEVGIRRRVSDKAVLSMAGSAGIGQQSPKFRVTIGFEYSP